MPGLARSACYDDFNADNFDHSDLKFIHGGVISLTQTGKRPIESNATPPGTRAWGSEFKKAAAYNFNRSLGIGAQGASIAYKANYLSLDKTYKDAYGLPLLRMTYNFTDQDRALFDYITKKIEEVAKAMNPKAMVSKPSPKDYNIVPYQTTHNTGGTITGIGETLKEKNPQIVIWAVEPQNAAILAGGTVGTHLQMGIGDGLIPENLNQKIYDDIYIVSDEEAIQTAKDLARLEGLMCGISSGTNVAAALKLAKKLGKGKTVVTVLPDTAERYFSTPLFENE